MSTPFACSGSGFGPDFRLLRLGWLAGWLSAFVFFEEVRILRMFFLNLLILYVFCFCCVALLFCFRYLDIRTYCIAALAVLFYVCFAIFVFLAWAPPFACSGSGFGLNFRLLRLGWLAGWLSGSGSG